MFSLATKISSLFVCFSRVIHGVAYQPVTDVFVCLLCVSSVTQLVLVRCQVLVHDTNKFRGLVLVLNAEFGAKGQAREPSGDAFRLLVNALSLSKR